VERRRALGADDCVSSPADVPGGRAETLAFASTQERGCRAAWVVPPVPATEEVAMSESTQDRPDEADEKAPKPGEPDTETEGGFPKEAPESKDGEEQSKQNQ
jgi:hypothetical protein